MYLKLNVFNYIYMYLMVFVYIFNGMTNFNFGKASPVNWDFSILDIVI